MRVIVLSVFVALTAGCGSVALTAMLIIAVAEEVENPKPFPSISTIYDWKGKTRVPPMDPERRVHEQDCSQPIEDPSANLKCR